MTHHQGLLSSRWAPANPHNEETSQMTTSHINSNHPNTQLQGSELQRYETPRTRTTGVQELQRYVVGLDAAHLHDMVHIHRLTNQNTHYIQEIQMVVNNDMTALDRRIRDLELGQSSSLLPHYLTNTRDLDCAPTDAMLNDNSTEHLATAYAQLADEVDEVASRLRQQAVVSGVEVYNPSHKMLDDGRPESAHPATDPATKTGHACCGIACDDFDGLLQHFRESHCEPAEPNALENITQEATSRPPARRIRHFGPGRRARLKSASGDGASLSAEKVDSVVGASTSNSITGPKDHSISTPKWTPVTVRNMPPIAFQIPADHTETFEYDLLRHELGGSLWSDGFYHDAHSTLPNKAYWLLEHDCEPFVPQEPGQHGAKLSAFFRDPRTTSDPSPVDYMNCPVFIREKGKSAYRYYGNYSQTRYSDKLSYDDLVDHVPEKTLRQWADHLAANGRPQWVTDALQKHFFPKPEYEGHIPTDSAISTPATATTGGDSGAGGIERRVMNGLHDYAEDLKIWQKDAHLKTSMLKSDTIFNAFKIPDSEIEPGMRLWWEYMEFANYNTQLYEALVKFKRNRKQARPIHPKIITRPAVRIDSLMAAPNVGGKTIPAANVSTVHLDDEPVDEEPIDESKLYTIPIDDTPVDLNPVHPPGPDPKKLQREQWQSFDMAQAEIDAKKLTKFVKPDFGNNPHLNVARNHLKKAAGEAGVKKPRSHLSSVKPLNLRKKAEESSGAGGWGFAAGNAWEIKGKQAETKKSEVRSGWGVATKKEAEMKPEESGGWGGPTNPWEPKAKAKEETKSEKQAGGAKDETKPEKQAAKDWGGDMAAVKEFNNKVQDGRSLRTGKGKKPTAASVPPHLRSSTTPPHLRHK